MRHALFLASVLSSIAAVASPALGQGGGFAAGDLYLFSPAIQGASSVDGALVRIDLASGTASIFVDTFSTPSLQGAMAFDPYRQRIVFCAGLGSIAAPRRLWAADAAGGLTDMGFSGSLFTSLAPTGDGRIYLRENVAATPFGYVDALGALHTLMDDTGTAPFQFATSYDVRGMIYDAGTNALFVAAGSGYGCPGGPITMVSVRKLSLSADGSRVTGAIGCAAFEVSASGETPVGFSRGPGGSVMLVVDTNSNAQEPRILAIDPVSLSITAFASNGNPFAAATNAGTWSSALGKMVLLETGSDKLVAFGAGETGAGSALAISGTVSSAGGSGEVASMIEIEPSGCAGAWLPYGSGLAGAGGFVPSLLGSGCPQAGGSFAITIDHVAGGASGIVFAGTTASSLPFLGGNLLVFPIVVQVNVGVGGAAGAPGAGSITLPVQLAADPALSGLSIYMQALFSDPTAVKGVSFTQGLEMEIG